VPGRAPLLVGAYGAAALAGLSALTTAYWTAGGSLLLGTVGGGLEELARSGGAAAVAVGVVVVLLKVVGCVLALALVRPSGRRLPPRLLEGTAMLAGGALAVYGGLLVLVGAIALTGALGEVADPSALRWHVLLWDPWFLVWGVLLVVASVRRKQLRRAVPR
jgi:hypothetical protein